ncbi:MAG: glycosyltransferase family 39 protein [bacterium]|nr:glycosyltransferase family 39 protein [bacterium]
MKRAVSGPVALCLAIVAAGIALRCWGLTDRWAGGHHGWNGAVYSHVARNHLRYGFRATRFVMARDAGGHAPPRSFYLHHPPLLPVVTAGVFAILGESEAAARAIPILFSAGNLMLLFLILRPVLGPGAALLGVCFAAFMTMDLFYGPQVEVFGSMVLFFILMSYASYRSWRAAPQRRLPALSVIAFVLAIATEWTGYYALVLIAVEEIARPRPDRKERPVLRYYLAAGAAGIALFLLAVRSVTGSVFGGAWMKTLLFRLNIGAPPAYAFTMREYALRLRSYLETLLGWPAIILAGIGAAVLFARRGGSREARVVALNLLVLGWLHPAVFTNAAYIHTYVLFNVTPSFALLAAVGAARLYEPLSRLSRPLGALFIAAVLVLHGASGLRGLERERAALRFHDGHRLGGIIGSMTAPDETTVISFYGRPEFRYYADRDLIRNVRTREDFDRALAEAGGRRIVLYATGTSGRDLADDELLAHLAERYGEKRVGEYRLFRLRGDCPGSPP